MPKKKDSWGDAAANTPWSKRIPPAPGDLRIVQAFVNTYDKDAGTDELASPEALGNWFTRWGLAVGEIRISAADFKPSNPASRASRRAAPAPPKRIRNGTSDARRSSRSTTFGVTLAPQFNWIRDHSPWRISSACDPE